MSFLYSITEDPPVKQPMHMNFPQTINDKQVFRLSIASQSSTTTASASTSSQRLSVASSSNEDDTKVAYCPTTSSSSRYSENLRNKVLNRFYPSSNRHQKSLSDPFTANTGMASSTLLDLGTDSIANHMDTHCMSLKMAQDSCIMSDWLQKYQQQTFFRSRKKRLFILVDRIVYSFKSSKSTAPANEHFVLTEDTCVFVTEEFKNGYNIELQKPLCKWIIQCESINQMKLWLEAMKKIVACIKIGYHGLLTGSLLASVQLTDDHRILILSKEAASHMDSKQHNRQSIPVSVICNMADNNKLLSCGNRPPPPTKIQQSVADIPHWVSVLPPQLPPPTSKLPPVPTSSISHLHNST